MAHESPQHELAKAIVAKWEATSALTTFFSRLYRQGDQYAASGLTIPYATFQLASRKEYSTTEREYWQHNVEFELFHRTETLAATGLAYIKGIFNDSPIVLTLGNDQRFESCRIEDESNEKDDKSIQRATLAVTIRTSCPV